MDLKTKLKFPLQLTIVGRTRSGKSYLLRKHIIPEIIKQYTDVFIFAPTVLMDPGWLEIEKKYPKRVSMFAEFDNESILELMEGIKEKKEDGSKDKYLFIFDDVTDRLSQSPKSYFTKLAIFGRHYNVSYIVTSHKYRSLNRTMRNNVTSKIFFKINSKPELKAVVDENETLHVDSDTLENMIDKCTGDYKAFLIQNGSDDDQYYCIKNDGKIVKVVSTIR